MIRLSIFLSVITLLILTTTYVDENAISAVKSNKLSTVIFNKPHTPDKELLSFEKAWLMLAKQSVTPIIEKTITPTSLNNTILINDKIYVLYGVFYSADNPFILIGSDKDKIIKVYLGHELSQGVKLVKVKPTTISFKQNDEFIEFKLFQRKKHT